MTTNNLIQDDNVSMAEHLLFQLEQEGLDNKAIQTLMKIPVIRGLLNKQTARGDMFRRRMMEEIHTRGVRGVMLNNAEMRIKELEHIIRTNVDGWEVLVNETPSEPKYQEVDTTQMIGAFIYNWLDEKVTAAVGFLKCTKQFEDAGITPSNDIKQLLMDEAFVMAQGDVLNDSNS